MRKNSSIRPGLNAGDPVVTDIRALQYKSSGVITYKLHFSDEYLEVPKRAMRLASNEQVELEAYSRPAKTKPLNIGTYNNLSRCYQKIIIVSMMEKIKK